VGLEPTTGRTEVSLPGEWEVRSAPGGLLPEEVHVWRIRLDIPDWTAQLERGPLSEDEVGCAQRFRFEADRRRFVVCRAAVRAILGAYLDMHPRELVFRAGTYGKPFLDAAVYGTRVCFNVSGSYELALVGVSRGRELGVDVEFLRPLDRVNDIAARHFSSGEQLALRRVPLDARVRAFFTYWTLKEAYLKARGTGLSGSLAEFVVPSALEEPGRVPELFSCRDPERCWTLRRLEPGPGYVGGLAVEGKGCCLRQWEWRASP
jgi:4'-phosphopantetheinyl transferase